MHECASTKAAKGGSTNWRNFLVAAGSVKVQFQRSMTGAAGRGVALEHLVWEGDVLKAFPIAYIDWQAVYAGWQKVGVVTPETGENAGEELGVVAVNDIIGIAG